MQTIGISIGGSILSTKEGYNIEFAQRFARLLSSYKDYKFVIVTGGGYLARDYIRLTKTLVDDAYLLDEIGTTVTKLNAMMLKNVFKKGEVYPSIPTTLDEVKAAHSISKIVVLGGLMEGITTDTDTVLACEAVGAASMLNVSKEAFVYDRDPKEPGAKKLLNLTYEQMLSIASKYDTRGPGTNFIFDVIATGLARRSGMKVIFTDSDTEHIKQAIEGKKHYGSLMGPDGEKK
jgi:uridylate kinase